jgi:predicted SnoaL-like aldol condensation-catalyzing enzyme
MKAVTSYVLCLGLSTGGVACSDEAPDTATAVEPNTAAPGPEASGEDTAAPGPEASGEDTAPNTAAPAELQPALPVLENPDHEALLASDASDLADNKRLVYDLWRTLIEARDIEVAEQYLAEGYIQHNPNADTGRAGVLSLFSSFGPPLEIQERVQTPLVAIVAERDLVALVQVDAYEEPTPYTTTWFDLFRIEDGLVAEHWDHGRLPADGTPRAYVPTEENANQEASLSSDTAELASNKRLVYDMWRTLLDAQQVEEAPNFLAEGYIQHNPLANTGLEGFLAFFRQFAQPRQVEPRVNGFIEMIAEDDLVVLATVRQYPDANQTPYTTTWFDMFRVGDDLLVEHWDTQTIPVP